jgi:formylmethanofuran dehydrogenase subunit C
MHREGRMAWRALRNSIIEPALAAANRFKGFKPEIEHATREAVPTEDEKLKAIIYGWKKFKEMTNHYGVFENPVRFVELYAGKITAEDIARFSIAMGGLQHEKDFGKFMGYYLNALVERGDGNVFTIYTDHIGDRLHKLGWNNTRRIIVHGDAGEDAGYCMDSGGILVKGNAGESIGTAMKGGAIIVDGNAGKHAASWMHGGYLVINGNAAGYPGACMQNGSILIKGNAGDCAGDQMKNGSIVIEGDAEDNAGWQMEGGSLTIKGNAGVRFGCRMKGGEIHIDGDFMGLSDDIEHGKIFHKGKLIVDK